MKVLSGIDFLSSFFFIGAKGTACQNRYSILLDNDRKATGTSSPDDYTTLIRAKACYEIEIKRGLGLGFFASFFLPGTDAFKARVYYVNSIRASYESIRRRTQDQRLSFFIKLSYLLTTTPFYFSKTVAKIVRLFFWQYSDTADGALINILYNQKAPIFKLLTYFPLLSDVLYYSVASKKFSFAGGRNLLHTLINPVRLLADFLKFLHRTVDTVIEIGVRQSKESFILRKILKGISAFIFLPLRFLAATLVGIVDTFWSLAWALVHTLTIAPIKFFLSSVKQMYTYWDKEFLLTKEENLRGGKVIRKIFKATDDEDVSDKTYFDLYSEIKGKNNHTKYVLQAKDSIYREALTNDFTIIATSPEKARNMKQNIHFFKEYKKEHPDFQMDANKEIDSAFIEVVKGAYF